MKFVTMLSIGLLGLAPVTQADHTRPSPCNFSLTLSADLAGFLNDLTTVLSAKDPGTQLLKIKKLSATELELFKTELKAYQTLERPEIVASLKTSETRPEVLQVLDALSDVIRFKWVQLAQTDQKLNTAAKWGALPAGLGGILTYGSTQFISFANGPLFQTGGKYAAITSIATLAATYLAKKFLVRTPFTSEFAVLLSVGEIAYFQAKLKTLHDEVLASLHPDPKQVNWGGKRVDRSWARIEKILATRSYEILRGYR